MTYPVSEDTLLLLENLREMDLEGKEFLDMGTGNGKIALEAAKMGAEVTAADISDKAVEEVREKTSEQKVELSVVQSDLMENIDRKFDIIAFNPPYLPGRRESGEDPLVGGETGVEVAKRFIEDVDEYLKEEGKVYLLLSSLGDVGEIEDRMEHVETRELWFEKLELYEYPG